MKRYMLNIYQPDGGPPSPEVLEPVMRELAAVNQEIKAAGAWVFTAGLHDASTATVVRYREGDVLTTDGPFAEGKEHIGGFYIIQAPDLDAALGWAARVSRATTLPIEVRPLHDAPEASERTVWIAGEPREVPPVAFDGLRGVGGLRFEPVAVRAKRENYLLVRSDYEQPFGTFRGELPGAGDLREGWGVMERHDVRW